MDQNIPTLKVLHKPMLLNTFSVRFFVPTNYPGSRRSRRSLRELLTLGYDAERLWRKRFFPILKNTFGETHVTLFCLRCHLPQLDSQREC